MRMVPKYVIQVFNKNGPESLYGTFTTYETPQEWIERSYFGGAKHQYRFVVYRVDPIPESTWVARVVTTTVVEKEVEG